MATRTYEPIPDGFRHDANGKRFRGVLGTPRENWRRRGACPQLYNTDPGSTVQSQVDGGVKADETEEDEGEGGGGKVDMKVLAKNVDVTEMEKVLKVGFYQFAIASWLTVK